MTLLARQQTTLVQKMYKHLAIRSNCIYQKNLYNLFKKGINNFTNGEMMKKTIASLLLLFSIQPTCCAMEKEPLIAEPTTNNKSINTLSIEEHLFLFESPTKQEKAREKQKAQAKCCLAAAGITVFGATCCTLGAFTVLFFDYLLGK